MRRQSFSSSLSSSSGGTGEPLIVVEESAQGEEEAEKRRSESPPRCLDPDSPSLNPYLLSPWREARKHSLPTPQCTSGITASQVRRLSERGGEGSGPSPREAAFLATLSQSQPPQPGGRRHSVVTISRVPSTLFGRNRRESIAAFPMGGATRVLGNRRDSTGPPSNSGSTHNLALDIMDDIAEIKAARKVRLKMWRTPSRERVCEVQPLEGNGSAAAGAQRYTQNQQRRYSDFSLATIPAGAAGLLPASLARRRASEMPAARAALGPPPPIPPRSGAPGAPASSSSTSSGIVCTNTDLISILSSLTSSATEIDRCGLDDDAAKPTTAASSKTVDQKRDRLKSNRSNSFDVSILHGCGADSGRSSALAALSKNPAGGASIISPSSWFAKRHQPMAKKQRSVESPSATLSFKFERSRVVKAVKDTLAKTSPTKDEVAAAAAAARHKVVWDDTSGTKVDAQVLGNAIEEFLRSGVTTANESSEAQDPGKVLSPGKPPRGGKVATWFGAAGTSNNSSNPAATPTASNKEAADQTESCEPSICSSLKDLFVK